MQGVLGVCRTYGLRRSDNVGSSSTVEEENVPDVSSSLGKDEMQVYLETQPGFLQLSNLLRSWSWLWLVKPRVQSPQYYLHLRDRFAQSFDESRGQNPATHLPEKRCGPPPLRFTELSLYTRK